MITNEQLQTLKGRLEKEREELLSSIKKLEHPIDYEDVPGPDDETDEATAFSNQTAAAGSLRERLADVGSALQKIDEGSYGVCEKTQQSIPYEALDINPALRFHPDVVRDINKTE